MRSRRASTKAPERALLWLVLAVLVAASVPAMAQTPAAPKPVAIDMRNTKFDPQIATAQTNATVTWTNRDAFGHDVQFVGSNISSPGGSGGVTSGQKFEHKFDRPGVYDYFCRAHSPAGFSETGMWGRLIVMNAPYKELGGGAEAVNPEHIGVRWLAHWVGVISFVAVFAVLIVYYFVLKYGETVHATDHRDRKEK